MKTYLTNVVKRGWLATSYYSIKRFSVTQRSPYKNIYHCCTQRTASQWFAKVFSDPIFYQYTGLGVYQYRQFPRMISEARLESPIPKYTIGANFYIDYNTYLKFPKPKSHKVFFILRDPRDVVVSWYFSTKSSHVPTNLIMATRPLLESLSLEEGLKYSINFLKFYGLFDSQLSWVQGAKQNPNIKIYRYEDLAENNFNFLKEILKYLEVQLPEQTLNYFCNKHQFKNYTKGRIQGEEEINSHYRKGLSGDWQNYFTDSVSEHFCQVTKDLLETLEY